MQGWTLHDISAWVIWISGFIGGITVIIRAIKTSIANGFKPIEQKIDKVDLNATKNYLVSVLDDLDQGKELNDVSKQRAHEQYQHYLELGGNSFLKTKMERAIKEGKI